MLFKSFLDHIYEKAGNALGDPDQIDMDHLFLWCLKAVNYGIESIMPQNSINSKIKIEYAAMVDMFKLHAIDTIRCEHTLADQLEKRDVYAEDSAKMAFALFLLDLCKDIITPDLYIEYAICKPTPTIQTVLDTSHLMTAASGQEHDNTGTAPDDATVLGNDVTALGGDVTALGAEPTVLNNEATAFVHAASATAPVSDKLLLGLYDIVGDPIIGGMGSVLRVHHKSWNVDLAMKQPHAELFQTEKQKQMFINECEAWIGLGLHPHIVSCYYVRDISGIPSIFAEWIDGGSLKDTIRDETLYDGNDAQVLERILDIAIQFAKGLHYAHEKGLIHQDVKPDNLLLTQSGSAKVADFGVAKARALTAQTKSNGGTLVSKSGGYSTPYYSPEQRDGLPLTRRTDIWSWAVSVLEMFFGEYTWMDGVVAGQKCEHYFGEARLTPPEDVKALLQHCFKEDEAERPHDFGDIEQALLEIYESNVGKPYTKKSLQMLNDTADIINNRALSFIDMGKNSTAKEYFAKALKANPSHIEANYNNALFEWRTGEIFDLVLVEKLKTFAGNITDDRFGYNLVKIHLERGSDDDAIALIDEIIKKNPQKKEALKQYREFAKYRRSSWISEKKTHIYVYDTHEKKPLLSSGRNIGYYYISHDNKIRLQYNTISYQQAMNRHNINNAPLIIPTPSIVLVDNQTGNIKKQFFSQYAGYDLIHTCFTPDEKNIIALFEGKAKTTPTKTLCIALIDIGTYRCMSSCFFKVQSSQELYTMLFSKDGKAMKIQDEYTVLNYPQFDYQADYELCTLKSYTTCLDAESKHNAKANAVRQMLSKNDVAGALFELNQSCEIPGFAESALFYDLDTEVSKYCVRKKIKSCKLFDNKKAAYHNIFSGKVLLSPDGTLMMNLTHPPYVLYDAKNKKTIIPKVCHDTSIISAAEFSRDNSRLIIASESPNAIDGKTTKTYAIKIWDANTGKQILSASSKSKVYEIKVAPDNQRIIIVTGQDVFCLRIQDGAKFYHFIFSSRGHHVIDKACSKIAVINDIGRTHMADVWDLYTGKKICAIKLQNGRDFNRISISEEYLMVSFSGINIDIYSLKSQALIRSFYNKESNAKVSAFWMSECRSFLYMINTDKVLRVFHVASREPAGSLDISSDYDKITASQKEREQLRFAWEYEFPGWKDWDERAKGAVESFVTNYPEFTERQFNSLIQILQNCGLGWIRPEGVRTKLEEIAKQRR